MGKTRVYELAKAIGVAKEELVEKINDMNLGFMVNNYMSAISDEQATTVRDTIERARRKTVVQERIRPTVIRRRSNKKREESASARPSAPVGASTPGAMVRRPERPAVRDVQPKPAQPVAAGVRVRPRREAPAPVEAQVVAPKPVEPRVEVPKVEPQAAKPEVKPVEPKVEAPKVEVRPEEPMAKPLEPEVKAAEPKVVEPEVKPAEPKVEAPKVEAKLVEPKAVEPGPIAVEPKPEAPKAPKAAQPEVTPGEPKDKTEAPEVKTVEPVRARVVEPGPTVARIVSRPAQGDGPEEVRVRRRPKPRQKQPSNIAGFIDPELIRKRLAKDNKTFTPGPSKAPERRQSRSDQAPRRKVVNQRDLYTGGQNQRRRGRGGKGKGKNKQQTPIERPQLTKAAQHKRVLRIADGITVANMAHEMGVKASEIIKMLMGMGMMMTVNQTLDVETSELVAQEFGFQVQDISFKEEDFIDSEVDQPEDMELRPPVVTVMGHVDHGKTSLLDALRNTRVTASEAGGITQHIGASTIATDGGKVVCLDTPGHEAFTALRARGAKVTDLVVLVVAADDGVMPQTVEAINHARAAEVPILVAVNKIDKPGANPQRVKQALTEYELIPEDWGGSTIFVEVSALTGANITELLEMIQLQSELLELKANPDKSARGIVLEAFKHSGRGTVATLIVQEGTLRLGDIVVCGGVYGRVRTMNNERRKSFKEALPSTPAEITGLSGVPEAGETFFVVESEKVAKQFTEEIKTRRRQAELVTARKVDPWAALKETKQLNVIIKADVQGSVEALAQSLEKLSTEEVEVVIRHSGVGGATESDVQLAVASSALIIGFNTRPESRAIEVAKREGVTFENHSVIYDVIDRVRTAMAGLLDPVFEEHSVGMAEVRETFSVPKVGTVAGCYVTDGKIIRGAKARLIRQGKVIYDSRIGSLRRFKDDAKEVKAGFECGLSVDNYNDVKVGDVVEVYEIEEVAATLD